MTIHAINILLIIRQWLNDHPADHGDNDRASQRDWLRQAFPLLDEREQDLALDTLQLAGIGEQPANPNLFNQAIYCTTLVDETAHIAIHDHTELMFTRDFNRKKRPS